MLYCTWRIPRAMLVSKLARVAFPLCLATLPLFAQTATTSAATLIEPAKTMDALISDTEKEIVPLAEAMPAERYSFAPANADFKALKPVYDGVSTFGQQVAHMAQANYFYGSAFSGLKPGVDVKAIGKQTGKAEAVKSLKESFAFLHQAAATLTTANAFEHVAKAEPNDTRISLAAAGMTHERNHYGQLVEYLRMNGIVPPASQGHAPANPPAAK